VTFLFHILRSRGLAELRRLMPKEESSGHADCAMFAGRPTTIEGPGGGMAAIVEREGLCKHCREPAALIRDSGVAHVGHVEPRCEGWMSAVRQAKAAGLGPADMAASNIIPTETLT
jgi:hypothetical protein